MIHKGVIGTRDRVASLQPLLAPPSPLEDPQAMPSPSDASALRPRILVVDDEEPHRRAVVEQLGGAPLFAEVTEAADGSTALRLALERDYDLVITDWNMPVMDGISFLRAVRLQRTRVQLPVLILSARDNVTDKVLGFRVGASDFVTKPFQPAELLVRVETHVALSRMNRQLTELAHHDALTQLWNRRRFMEALDSELVRSRRTGRSLCLLMVDVDHFKSINDTYGHPAGDGVLAHLARLLGIHRRAYDSVGRLGGEEFAALLPETRLPDAVTVAERLRVLVEGASVGGLPAGRVTISVGVTQAPVDDRDSVTTIYGRADACLYRAKNSGRNRVVGTLSELAPTA
ncbi:MAG: diguanylate cyclase [Myxococcota bacterium]